MKHQQQKPQSTRRTFLKTTGGALAAGTAAPGLAAMSNPHVAGEDLIRVGLIGCGGRGTGAATQALNADDNVKLVAMGDAFGDRLTSSLERIQRSPELAAKVDVPPERQFVGFDAYKDVIANVDVVLLTTPPHFRPAHLKEVIDQGKHCFVEKPVAVDAPGIRSIIETCKQAKEKNLSIVSGLCYRYHHGRRAILNEIHEGRIGDIVALHVDYVTGALWSHPRQQAWSDMEYQMRNWLYYTWLSGDHIAEQHIHSLDVMAWAMQDKYPTSAYSLGGRQVRTEPIFGHIYDHFANIYEWDSGVKGFSYCRQQKQCFRQTNDFVLGSKGRANVFRHQIEGPNEWSLGRLPRGHNMYQNEHDEMFAAIRAGNPINDNGDYMWRSTLMAIMGRMAAYTGQRITWDQALASEENLSPRSYEWGPIATPDVALPGITQFV